jgi:soluble lytic murein transglycosylase-like protein
MQPLLLKLHADITARKQPRELVRLPPRMWAVAALLLFTAYQIGSWAADRSAGWAAGLAGDAQARQLADQVESLRGEADLQRAYIERLERIQQRSATYGISADLAASIEDIALAENIDPQLAFELVRVESRFTQRAVSPAGAIGLTQLMPATARYLQPGIERHQLFDRETNLRLGFRFLKILTDQYNGDVRLALLAYNRGPATVDRLLASGIDPNNAYARLVLGASHPALKRGGPAQCSGAS